MLLKVLDLFSGLGGFTLGLERTGGFQTVAFCEIEEHPRKVLARHWPGVPIYEDVRALTAERLRADGIAADVICGGFPCQDISIAGECAGIDAARSGLWSEYWRIVGEVRPRFVLVENVTNLLAGPEERPGVWFGRVLGDLAAIGYDAEWHCIPASAVGAAHVRDRVWIIAYPSCEGRERPIADQRTLIREVAAFAVSSNAHVDEWCAVVRVEFGVRNGDGISVAVERARIKHLGNAVVPQIPELIGRAILAAE